MKQIKATKKVTFASIDNSTPVTSSTPVTVTTNVAPVTVTANIPPVVASSAPVNEPSTTHVNTQKQNNFFQKEETSSIRSNDIAPIVSLQEGGCEIDSVLEKSQRVNLNFSQDKIASKVFSQVQEDNGLSLVGLEQLINVNKGSAYTKQ